jgi:hypothetical protein
MPARARVYQPHTAAAEAAPFRFWAIVLVALCGASWFALFAVAKLAAGLI